MVTRRKLLQMKAAILAAPVISKAADAAGLPAPQLSGHVLFDDRNSDCNQFADYARKAGAAPTARIAVASQGAAGSAVEWRSIVSMLLR